MDYLYFQSPQPYQLLGHPFTPHFSRDEQAELGGPIPPDFAEVSRESRRRGAVGLREIRGAGPTDLMSPYSIR